MAKILGYGELKFYQRRWIYLTPRELKELLTGERMQLKIWFFSILFYKCKEKME